MSHGQKISTVPIKNRNRDQYTSNHKPQHKPHHKSMSKPEIKQHSIWMVNLGNDSVGHEQRGNRPFYVISSSGYNKMSNTPIGFFLSTSEKKSQNRFAVKCSVGWVNSSQIRTISSERFLYFMGESDKATTMKVLETMVDEVL